MIHGRVRAYGQNTLRRCPDPAIGSIFLYAMFLLNIAVIEGVAAFGTELRRLYALFGFPAALVALVLGNAGRLLCAAFCADLALVYRAAGAGPAVISRLGRTAFGTEFAGHRRAALAGPRIRGLFFGLLRSAFGAELAVAVAPQEHFQPFAAGAGAAAGAAACC